MADLSHILEQLSPDQRRLFLRRVKSRTDLVKVNEPGLCEHERIVARDSTAPPPLSFGQERMWFLNQLDPENVAYNLLAALTLEGRLDVRAFRDAVSEVVRRHESLRTSFCYVSNGNGNEGRRLVQKIDKNFQRLSIPLVDVSELEDSDTEMRRMISNMVSRPFDLGSGPLLRMLLVRLGGRRHGVAISMHHIVTDRWSVEIFLKEVRRIYSDSVAGRRASLPPLDIQYADFAVWQRRWLESDELDRQITFWRRRLDGAPQVLKLWTDRPRPNAQSFRGGRVGVSLGATQVGNLRRLCHRAGATLFMGLAAAYQTLLSRYSDGKDIVMGTPIAGRNRVEVEPLIGLFVNTLVLRADLGGDPSFERLLKQAKEMTAEAYDRQDVPFERLVEELQPERSLNHAPLFQVVFNFSRRAAAGETVGLSGLEIQPIELDAATAMFDLVLTLEETVWGTNGTLEYSSDLFNRSTAQRMARHFENLVAEIVSDPGRRLSELPMLSVYERWHLTSEWNDTLYLAQSPRIEKLFERQADLRPDALAVATSRIVLSYQELEQRANRLAHLLRSLGLGSEDLVGVFLDRSEEMAVALLGILKAGAAYVPLETRNPEARLRWILREMKIRVTLFEPARLALALSLLPSLPSLRDIVCLGPVDEDPSGVAPGRRIFDSAELAAQRTERPSHRGGPDDLAYVIFTSGSTGAPKGVTERHRPVFNLIDWVNRTFAVGPGDRLLFSTSLGFDLSVYDIFGVLGAGGSIRVASDWELSEPRELVRIVSGERITFWDSAPAALQRLTPFLPRMEEADPGALRLVFLSGDWIPLSLPDRVRASYRGARVISLGGATEATIWSNFFPVTEVKSGWSSIPYGRPIRNARYYVLDAYLELCPIGVAGDLFIGGECLSGGYAQAPSLTADRYLPDPLAVRPGAVMYRTGDRARFFTDGNIEFLGRLDHQVKLRGFRIELGEIEAAISSHPALRDQVVLLREDQPGDQRLIAYLVASDSEKLLPEELQRFVEKRLPEYMVPQSFVVMDAIPLTPNGKVDRKALPAPQEATDEKPRVAPGDPVEEILAGIWAEVLKVRNFGILDDFFELGGHSLLATQVVSRVQEAFGLELPVRALFERPTVSQLAKEVSAALAAGVRVEVPPIEATPRGGDLPLSFAQERLWFLYQMAPESPAYNIASAMTFGKSLDLAVLEKVFDEIAQRHEILRTTFHVDSGRPVVRVAADSPEALRRVDLTRLDWERRQLTARDLMELEAWTPFTLEKGPMLRILVLDLGSGGYVLVVTMHHVVSDAWSMQILTSEVSALYKAFSSGHASPLPGLPVQYADFAVWQRRCFDEEMLEAETGHWCRRLYGSPVALELPTDRRRPAVQNHEGAFLHFDLPEALSRDLNRFAMLRTATPFMLLLAVFEALLQRFSGQRRFLVGTPVANRRRVEIEALIGFFANTLVLPADLTGDPTLEELLAQVREVTLEAYAHQDMPFEKLVEELAPVRDLSRNPLFQVMLAVQNVARAEVADLGLEVTNLSLRGGQAHFDMTLFATSAGERIRSIDLRYATRLFDRTTAARLAKRFVCLLDSWIEKPELTLSEIPALSAGENHQVLVEWGRGTAGAGIAGATVPEVFSSRAEATPDHVAVVCGGEHLTFSALGRRSCGLARELRIRGVGREVAVALFLERKAEMVTAILAVLEAGGVYVPFDPRYPKQRIALMLDDAKALLLVTRAHLAGHFTELPSGTLFLEGEDLVPVRTSPVAEPPVVPAESAEPMPANTAYVIYTSGSTGRPKGVMVSHQALIHYTRAMRSALRLESDARYLHTASFAFSSSVRQLMMPLLAGATAVLADAESIGDPRRLFMEVGRRRVSVMDIVPTYWRSAVESLEALPADERRASLGDGLVRIVSASEPLPLETPRRFRGLNGGRVELVNMFGQTETAGIVAVFPVPEELEDTALTPIGRPIPGLEIYLLDPNMNLAAERVPGGVYVGGPTLGRGYLGLPGATAESFVPHALCRVPGERLYRTGDMARHRADGSLSFLGRRDDQIKIRGFRVEPGEVERFLADRSDVKAAAVIAREAGGDKRLVGYLVPSSDPPPPAAELRADLAGRLPDYMVPAVFVYLDDLPLTSSGKVNRRLLPAPEEARGEVPIAAEQAPRTPTEELLVGIFSKVLGRDDVGIFDNFFDLGGHSLLATQMVSHVRETFEVAFEVRIVFELPTVAGLASKIEERRRIGDTETAFRIKALPRSLELPAESFPSSFAQQRMWFLDQLQPDSAAYNIPTLLAHIHGPLDPVALEAAYSEVVGRHEILRTTFDIHTGELVQVVARKGLAELPRVDLRALPAPRRAPEVLRQARIDSQRRFDLGSGPLMRFTLFAVDEGLSDVMLTIHHIVFDGWSAGIFLNEIEQLYDAVSHGQPSPLPALALQYADFSAWQYAWLSGERYEALVDFWRRQLADSPAVLELPTDRPRPAVQSYDGFGMNKRLRADIDAELWALAREKRATLYIVLAAAFKTLLSRYTGQIDLLMGMPIANRTHLQLDGLIGFFVNTLVLRTDLGGDPSFSELVARVRKTTLDAHAHQDLPFEKLVDELQPVRDTSYTPYFQVLFDLQNQPWITDLERQLKPPHTVRAKIRVEPYLTEGDQARFDLSLSFTAFKGLSLDLWYARSLFDRSTVERMVGHLEQLLDSALEDPERRLFELQVLSPGECHQMLREWHGDSTSDPWAAYTLPAAFVAQVARTPEAIAVVSEDSRLLTYDELDRQSLGLARRLRSIGVGHESRVGIMVEPSLEMLVGLLGVSRAGGAYVPMDPAYPEGRLTYMAEDAALATLIVDGRQEALLTDYKGPRVSLPGTRIRDEKDTRAEENIDPRSLAYVIYTSGSTGEPKGVEVHHGALMNFLASMRERLSFGTSERLLAVTTLSFDIAGLELYLPLLQGGKLELVQRESAADAGRLRRRMEASLPTLMQATPATWQLLIHGGWEGSRGLRVLCGGEALPPTLAAALVQRVDAIWNMYGPTETTIWSSMWKVGASRGPVLIGRPIAATNIYVLDPHGGPVPVGVAGELRIGGLGVARGYRLRPRLTSEKFAPDAYGVQPGQRLYRTGDLARLRSDGQMDFLGRIDHQIKLRGFRIELGEIEAALARHPAVQEAIVLAKDDKKLGRFLSAHVIRHPAKSPAESELRQFLEGRLPTYMIPSAWNFVETLPLTPNGKVDRRALAALELSRPKPGKAFVAPRTLTEELIAGIWSRLLGIERVGLEDDFFELRGHSLLATQLLVRLREVFEVELALRVIFEAPTLGGFARRVDQARQAGVAFETPSIVPVSGDERRPLSFAQHRLWFIDRMNPGNAAFNISSAVRWEGAFDMPAFLRALGDVTRRHESLRTTFDEVGGEPFQVIAPPAPVLWPKVDLRAVPAPMRAHEARRQTRWEVRRPFDLARGPLIHGVVFSLAETDHVVFVSVHHIVSDRWSMRILSRELAILYHAYLNGRPSPLPELRVQYADYASWQRLWLGRDRLKAHVAFWRDRLRNAPASPAKVTPDHPQRVRESSRGRRYPFELPAETAADLRTVARARGMTPFMVCLAALDLLLSRYAGSDDIVVGVMNSHRSLGELEGLIGFFVNILAIRTDLSGGPSVGDLLRHVREAVLEGMAHREVPFDKLVAELRKERGDTELFEVAFDYDARPSDVESELTRSDFTISNFMEDDELARFDLMLKIVESEDGFSGSWVYSTELYEVATITRLHTHFERLLRGLLASPDTSIGDLEMYTEEEKDEIERRKRARTQSKRKKLLDIKRNPLKAADRVPIG